MPKAHILDKAAEELSLGHSYGTVAILLSDLVHHQSGHVLVVNVEDQVWSALVNLPSHIMIHYVLEGIISLANIMLVD